MEHHSSAGAMFGKKELTTLPDEDIFDVGPFEARVYHVRHGRVTTKALIVRIFTGGVEDPETFVDHELSTEHRVDRFRGLHEEDRDMVGAYIDEVLTPEYSREPSSET